MGPRAEKPHPVRRLGALQREKVAADRGIVRMIGLGHPVNIGHPGVGRHVGKGPRGQRLTAKRREMGMKRARQRAGQRIPPQDDHRQPGALPQTARFGVRRPDLRQKSSQFGVQRAALRHPHGLTEHPRHEARGRGVNRDIRHHLDEAIHQRPDALCQHVTVAGSPQNGKISLDQHRQGVGNRSPTLCQQAGDVGPLFFMGHTPHRQRQMIQQSQNVAEVEAKPVGQTFVPRRVRHHVIGRMRQNARGFHAVGGLQFCCQTLVSILTKAAMTR